MINRWVRIDWSGPLTLHWSPWPDIVAAVMRMLPPPEVANALRILSRENLL